MALEGKGREGGEEGKAFLDAVQEGYDMCSLWGRWVFRGLWIKQHGVSSLGGIYWATAVWVSILILYV